MPHWIDIPAYALAVIVSIPIAVLCLECLAALLSRRPSTVTSTESRPPLAILIPAHNEQAGLPATLASISPQLLPHDRILVVADNCTDATAEIARQFPFTTVLERHDLLHRGKGYALDHGIRHLESSPPSIVVMIDADCTLTPNSLASLAFQVQQTQKPAQAAYLMHCPPNATPRASISSLAFIIKNIVRPLGLRTLGLPCLLTGTGMAFPWQTIRSAPLASANIVEDMQLGLDLSLAGHAPIACPAALLIGTIENKSPVAFRQRTRWEHGHLATLLHNTPRLLLASLRQRRPQLFALALEVAVPPIALLVFVIFAALAACIAAYIFLNISPLPAIILSSSSAALLICLLLAWARFARQRVPFRSLAAVPFYILWKLPLYLSFLTHRERRWVRTTRMPAVEPASPPLTPPSPAHS